MPRTATTGSGTRMFVSAGAIRDQSRRTGADIESWAAALFSPTASDSLSLGGTQPNRNYPAAALVERHLVGVVRCRSFAE